MEFVNVYLSSVKGPSRRGRPLGRWEDRVKKYMNEREVKRSGLEQARKKCKNGVKYRSFCRGHPLGDDPGGCEVLELFFFL